MDRKDKDKTVGAPLGTVVVVVITLGLLVYAWANIPLGERVEPGSALATLESTIPLMPDQRSGIAPPSLGADSESIKVLDASVTTSTPAKALHQLANALTESGKKYDVVVTVTRSDD